MNALPVNAQSIWHVEHMVGLGAGILVLILGTSIGHMAATRKMFGIEILPL